jgi:tRNA (mo5U34)-methyltransferase
MNDDLRDAVNRSGREQHAELLAGKWWHSIDLGGGLVTPGVHSLDELEHNFQMLDLPSNLEGKKLLDIGCWDGFYAFEAERRGASVVATDSWTPANFHEARRALNSSVEFYELSVYETTRERLGSFDIVLFLGVLYHLRHPLLALQRVCELTRDVAIIESHAIDNLAGTLHPIMEFYETNELGGQYDNWWGPTVTCLEAMIRSAGFVRSTVLKREPSRVTVKAWRTWQDQVLDHEPSLSIRAAANAISSELPIPCTGRLAFIDLSVEGISPETPLSELRVDVGSYGARPVFVGRSGDPGRSGTIQVNVPVPPGLDAGRVSISIQHGARWSPPIFIELVEGKEW